MLMSGKMHKEAPHEQPRLLQTVVSVLEEDGFSCGHEREGILTMTFSGDTGSWLLWAEVQEAEDWRAVTVFSLAPVVVPEARRLAVCELLTRINDGRRFGTFDMDMADGQVLCKTGLNMADGAMTKKMFEGILYMNLSLMNDMLAALMAVAFGGADPYSVLHVEKEREAQGQGTLQ